METKSIEDKDLNKAKIYYNNNPESKKFAAIFGNSLLDKGLKKEDIIVEEITASFTEESKILGSNAGILFFSGNINNDLGGIIQSSSSMNAAIREYYED